jgi:hypothetical protein
MVDLSNNNLGVPGASALAKLHVSHQLLLNNTNLGDEGLTFFVESLRLKTLGLKGNDIHDSGVSYLADAICLGEIGSSNNILNLLDLGGNPLGLEGAIALGRILSSNHFQLEYINLSRCDLTTAGGGLPSADSISCEAVGRQLCLMPQTSTIASVNLNHNSFTGDGIHILAGFMHLCPSLVCLFTLDCGITSDDLIWLLGKLKSSSPGLCSQLGKWCLNDNQIDGRGVSALMDHLPLLPHLWCNGFTSGIDSFSNNPVTHNIEIIERLEGELTRRHREREEEEHRGIDKRSEEEVQRAVR